MRLSPKAIALFCAKETLRGVLICSVIVGGVVAYAQATKPASSDIASGKVVKSSHLSFLFDRFTSDGRLKAGCSDGQTLVFQNGEAVCSDVPSGGGSGAGGTAAIWSSGWVRPPAAGGNRTFTHNLGTSDLIAQVWIADDASGTNSVLIDTTETFANTSVAGATVRKVTNTELDLQIGSHGIPIFNENGQNGPSPGAYNLSNVYMKVVAFGGADSVVAVGASAGGARCSEQAISTGSGRGTCHCTTTVGAHGDTGYFRGSGGSPRRSCSCGNFTCNNGVWDEL